LQPPVIVHSPLKNQSYWRWPALLNIYASDNVGVDEVRVYYSVNQSEVLYSILLEPAQVPGWYSGIFGLDTTQVEIGDTLHYMIQVRDKSIAGNSAVQPQSGYYSFALTAGGGEIDFDFEADDGGLTASGDWQWGIPTSGPRKALAGDRLWATQLDGYYSNGPLLSTLSLPPVNLRGFSVAALQLWQWYEIESGEDGGNIKVSADDGLNWQVLRPLFGYEGTLDTLAALPLAGEEVFYGTSSGWKKTYFNLDDYVDRTILIKFEFAADAAGSGFGWYIDSLAVVEKSARLYPPDNLTVLDDHVYIKLGWNYNHMLKAPLAATPGIGSPAEPAGYNLLFPEGLVFRIYRRQEGLPFNPVGDTDQYSFIDSTVEYGRRYTYCLTSLAGTLESEASDTIQAAVQAVIGVGNSGSAGIPPQTCALQQNYPNPFNPSTTIKFQLAEAGRAKLTVFDISGREVAVVLNEQKPAGYYQVQFHGNNISSGIYFYRLETEKYTETKKMLMIR
jgi:hypothetical protein